MWYYWADIYLFFMILLEWCSSWICSVTLKKKEKKHNKSQQLWDKGHKSNVTHAMTRRNLKDSEHDSIWFSLMGVVGCLPPKGGLGMNGLRTTALTVKKLCFTKVEKQQDGLIALIKHDHCLVNNNNSPVWTTKGGKLGICIHLKKKKQPGFQYS